MKRWIALFCVVVSLCGCLNAQDYKVVSVEHLSNDFSAREEMMTDERGRQCAMLRIATKDLTTEQRNGFFFECDMASWVVERRIMDGEIWLWVSPGLKTLKITHKDLGRYELHMATTGFGSIQPLNVYKVLIQGTFKAVPEGKVKPKKQYLAFQITPANATLEVNGQLWSVDADGSAMKYVDFGTYKYRVRASDYFDKEGEAKVDDPDNTKIVPVTLKPNFAEVTLKVDADAEIWVNNKRKGSRSWMGSLGAGTYKVECKQAGFETAETVMEITPAMNGKAITLPKPIPIYGSLMVESTPNFCKLFVDGKEMGTTPKSINEILVGQHEVKLTKEGYADHVETVTIAKEEVKQLKASLEVATQMVKTTNTTVPTGAIGGIFSVSENKKVYFSKGNLQYQASTNTWRFAEYQYDRIGNANSNNSSSYSGWIDLFGWGTSGYNGKSPIMTSTRHSDYGNGNKDVAGTNYDWGVNNKISNGGNQAGLWRTLTTDEWAYVFNTRKTPSGIRYAKANVNGVNGVILLPDDWNTSTFTLSKTNTSGAYFSSNTITATQWIKLEKAGAVFLPTAGRRKGTSVDRMYLYGGYWSASYGNEDCACSVYFQDSSLGPERWDYRNLGQSVRLVRSAQ